MDKKIFAASYWLGVACVVMTVIFRGLAALGIWPILVPANGPGSRTLPCTAQRGSFCCCPSPRA